MFATEQDRMRNMQERQVTVKIGGVIHFARHCWGSRYNLWSASSNMHSNMLPLPLVPFAAKSTFLSVLENTNVRRFTEPVNACLCPKSGLASMLIRLDLGKRLVREQAQKGEGERGSRDHGQRIIPMESNHGMAAEPRWRSRRNSAWTWSCAEKVPPMNMSFGDAPPKRTQTSAAGYQNTEMFILIDAYTGGLGVKERGRTVETGAGISPRIRSHQIKEPQTLKRREERFAAAPDDRG